MSATTAIAVALGIVLGLGLWSLVAMLPRMGASRLAERVAPHVLDVSAEARALRARRHGEPASVLAALVAPALERAGRGVATLLGGDTTVARRLRQSGSPLSVSGFRARQLLWTAGGAALGSVASLLLMRAAAVSPAVAAVLAVASAASGLLVPEQLLARRARSRMRRIAEELPTVLEFLSLALAAGETVRDSLRRVARIGSGDLAQEFRRVMADIEVGVSLTDALQRAAASLELPALTRVIEQLVTAIERGSPLVEVLRAQAQDARDDAKRQLLEAAGRKEVAMLVPLVFLILPVTVLFALFPATLVLELGF